MRVRVLVTFLVVLCLILGVAPGGIAHPLDDTVFAPIKAQDGIKLRLETVADGLTAPPLFVVDQNGILWAVDPASGSKAVLLDISGRLVTLGVCGPNTFDERGLLGVAFHPGYASNGRLYTYTSEPTGGPPTFPTTLPAEVAPDHQNVLAEWRVPNPGNPVPAQLLCLCYAPALRLEADRAEWAAARRRADDVAAARRRAAPVIAALDRLSSLPSPQARIPAVVCSLLLARAEQSRLEGRSDPERWQAIAVAWERLGYAFEAAYARFRQAEALLASGPHKQAETVLRPAHQMAVALGAGPLQREIELLAQRGRLRLEEPLDTTAPSAAPPSPAASLGLTRREVEVLALVAEGRTNRQIGQALFITPKTASVHVSRILAKLGVAGRGEAAAIAHRLGLDKQ
jgi:DNA-binding CsgD family transcriptional regulator